MLSTDIDSILKHAEYNITHWQSSLKPPKKSQPETTLSIFFQKWKDLIHPPTYLSYVIQYIQYYSWYQDETMFVIKPRLNIVYNISTSIHCYRILITEHHKFDILTDLHWQGQWQNQDCTFFTTQVRGTPWLSHPHNTDHLWPVDQTTVPLSIPLPTFFMG